MNIGIEQLLSLLTEGFTEQSMTIPLDREFLPPEQIKNLPPPIKSLYSNIFTKHKQPISLNNIMPFPIRTTKTPLCNKVLPITGISIRCYDCIEHEAAVFCVDCFDKGKHEGHRYSKLYSGSGNCDCGNKSAIKPSGFCPDHCGHAEKSEILEKDMKEFLMFFQYLFEWYFLLCAKNQKNNSEKLSLLLLGHLQTLNTDSIYYNQLTKELLMRSLNGKTILHKLFRVKNSKTIKVSCSLFYKMVSLEQFRFILATEFIDAYNHVQGFEDTQFHNLFLQLFAMNDLVEELIEKGFILCPKERKYKLVKILEDLLFITTISEPVSAKYFSRFFEMHRIIDLPFLDSIEEKVQVERRHIVNVSSFISDENFFYFLFETIMKVVRNQKRTLQKIIRELYQYLKSKKHTYARNCVVLPYHRAFSMAIFTIFHGSIQEITTKKLMQLLDISSDELHSFLSCSVKVLFKCMMEYAETFAKNSYFDQYSIIYVRSGCCCSRYDFLFIRTVACLYEYEGIKFTNILLQVMKQNSLQIEHKEKDLTLQEKIKQEISFLGLLVEIIVSNRVEVLLYKVFYLTNHKIELEYEDLVLSIFSLYKVLSFQNLKDAEKHFLGKIENWIFDKFLNYNKDTKKYLLRQEEKNIRQINSKYFVSLLKISNLFPRVPLRVDNEMYFHDKNIKIAKAFDFQPLTEIIGSQLLDSKKILDENSSQTLYQQLIQQIKKINHIRQKRKLEKIIFQNISSTFKTSQISCQPQKQNMKQKKLEKIRMIKQRQSQFLEKNQMQASENNQISDSEVKTCMMCKEKIEGSSVFWLAHISETNLFNFIKGNQKATNVCLSSCYHTVHLQCFDPKERKICPLCKTACNIFLPCLDIEYSKKDIQKLIEKFHWYVTYYFPINFYFGLCLSKKIIFCHLVQSIPELIGLYCMDLANGQKENKLSLSLMTFLKKIWELLDVGDKKFIINYFSLQNSVQKKQGKEISKQCQIIVSLQSCIIEAVLSSLIGHNHLSYNQVYQKYSKFLHESDLQIILGCLSRCLGQCFVPNPDIMIKKSPQNIPNLKQIVFNFYQPPKKIGQLLAMETKTMTRCDSAHRAGICIVCKKAFCYDCLQHEKHAEEAHANQMLFFSLYNGGVVYVQSILESSRSMFLHSLYENRFGEKWSTRFLPDGYYLEEKQYSKLLSLYVSHALKPYMMHVGQEGNGVGATFIVEQTIQ